ISADVSCSSKDSSGRACSRRRVATISGNAWSIRSPTVALAIRRSLPHRRRAGPAAGGPRGLESHSTDRRALRTSSSEGGAGEIEDGRGSGARRERTALPGPRRSEHAAALRAAERPRPPGREVRLRGRAVRCVQGADRRRGAADLPRAGRLVSWPDDRHDRGDRHARPSAPDPAGVHRRGSRAVRLLHPWHDRRCEGAARQAPRSDRRRDPGRARHQPLSLRNTCAHREGGPARGEGDAPVSDLPASLARHPELDMWVRIDPADTITLFSGKVELGQGLKAAIARIGAEELDVALERVRVSTADTAHGLNELFTVGSMSMEESGVAMRQVAAEARRHLLELAAARLGVPVERLEVEDGSVVASGTGARTTYWELLGGRR